MIKPSPPTRVGPLRPGLSLVEMVISIALVGGLLASVMSVVGVSAQQSLQNSKRSRAAWLARDLAAEIASKPCAANDSGVILDLGIVEIETGDDTLGLPLGGEPLASRKGFNDVFDYHDWSSTPPANPDGTRIPGFEGWTRSARVVSINPLTFANRSFNPAAAKITVSVSYRGEVLHVETLIRTARTDALRNTDAETPEIEGGGGLLDPVLDPILGGVLGL